MRPIAAFGAGSACLVASLWFGVGRTAGCVVLGAVGLVLLLVSAAAVAPDREVRR